MNLNLIARLAELTATSPWLDAVFTVLLFVGLALMLKVLIDLARAACNWLLCREEDEDIDQAELVRDPVTGIWTATLLGAPEMTGRGASAVDALADLINGHQEEFGFRVRLFVS